MAPNPVPAPRNIIFFGTAGVGKSSIINMLLGENDKKAPVSNGAMGCTFDSNVYPASIEGKEYRFYDTAGLGEGSKGTVVSGDALVKLYHLLRDLQDGISLLVYCARGPRITDSLERNYNIFYDGFCRKEVPIVMVVTGLEDEEPDMESWWTRNSHQFASYNMEFEDHACITASRGKKMADGMHKYQLEFNESSVILRDLIVERCLDVSWKLETNKWFVSVVKWMHRNLPSWVDDHIDPRLGDLYEILKESLPKKDAREIARKADMKKRNANPDTKKNRLRLFPRRTHLDPNSDKDSINTISESSRS